MSAAGPLPRRLALPEQLRAAGFTRLRLVVPGPYWQPGDVAAIVDWTPHAAGVWLQVHDRADVPAATIAAAQIVRGEWVYAPWRDTVDDEGVPYRTLVIYKRPPGEDDPFAATSAELDALVEEVMQDSARSSVAGGVS